MSSTHTSSITSAPPRRAPMLEEMLSRLATLRMFGKSPAGACLRLNEWIWNHVPRSVTSVGPFRSLGHLLHSLARLQDRRMYLGTFFLRNRPELELMRRLANPRR